MNSDFGKIKVLLGEGKLKEVIQLLHHRINESRHLNYLILQSARYYDIERAIDTNTVQWDNANIEKNRIIRSILNLIDELEADENEEQKYLTNEEEEGVAVSYQDSTENDATSISPDDWEVEERVLRFLKVFDRWYFSPLRIKNWGGRQRGFEDLSNYSSKKIKSILQKLLVSGKVKKILSQKGNPIYKIND